MVLTAPHFQEPESGLTFHWCLTNYHKLIGWNNTYFKVCRSEVWVGLVGFPTVSQVAQVRGCPGRAPFQRLCTRISSTCIQVPGRIQFPVLIGLWSLFPCWLSGGATFSFQGWLNSLSRNLTPSSSHNSSPNLSYTSEPLGFPLLLPTRDNSLFLMGSRVYIWHNWINSLLINSASAD